MKKSNKAITLLGLCCISLSGIAAINNSEKIHIIKQGDSLFSLAKQYQVTVNELIKWNNINNVDELHLGQKIIIKKANDSTLKIQAEQALTAKKYTLAIKLLTKLYQQGNNDERQFALEFLGVAREKKGQKAFAKQAYQTYLKKYPQAKNTKRVKLRLDNLIGIETLAKDRSFKTSRKNKGRKYNYTRGSLSTDYRHSILIDDLGNSRNTLSLGNVDIDIRGQHQIQDYDVNFRVSLGHYQDFLPEGKNTNQRIRYLSTKAKSKDNLYQLSIGRQRSRGKGIFGRFDGIILSSELYSDITINLYAGFPVASSKVTSLDPERKFYGMSVDVENSWQSIDFSLFIFEQKINKLTDRRAIGGQFNYFKKSTSVYGLVDYDIFFNELNALLLSGSYATQSSQRFSWSLNYRKSPYVGTRNALIGQSVDSFSELQSLFITDEEILDLALDRTLTSKTASLTFSQPLAKNYDLNTSITWMNLSGAPESGGVPAISESGSQYYTNLFLSARQLYSSRDNNTLGIRYSTLATSSVFSIYASSQYRFKNGFSILPKLRFDTRNNDNGTSQQNISPSLRLQYQSKKHYLYSDLGGIFYNTQTSLLPDQQTTIYYLYLGYRYYF